jgi:hypothetical protein
MFQLHQSISEEKKKQGWEFHYRLIQLLNHLIIIKFGEVKLLQTKRRQGN